MKFFSLYPSCALTKGASKSCLIDLERATYCSLPNELYHILKAKKNLNIIDLEKIHSKDDFKILKQYLSFLEVNKFIFFHSKISDTQYLSDTSYNTSFKIEDLIIDLDSLSKLDEIIKSVPSYIETIQLRFFFKVSVGELTDIVDMFRINGNTNIELLFNHTKLNSNGQYIDLFDENKIISKMIVMGHEESTQLLLNRIILIKEKLKTQKQCGIVSEKLFFPNLRTFLSSQNCNSCLNSKISIDIDGNIKNCPSMTETYGNIKHNLLTEVIKNNNFIKYWKTTKDQIEICKDCEFRYICTDCRAYKENPKNDYSKPLKCGYNPYTNDWVEWSTNPLKQKAIKYYGMEDLIKKND